MRIEKCDQIYDTFRSVSLVEEEGKEGRREGKRRGNEEDEWEEAGGKGWVGNGVAMIERKMGERGGKTRRGEKRREREGQRGEVKGTQVKRLNVTSLCLLITSRVLVRDEGRTMETRGEGRGKEGIGRE